MTPIAFSCAPGTPARQRLRWRLLGLVTINLAAWSAIIFTVKAFL